jgi:hypothetical protein
VKAPYTFTVLIALTSRITFKTLQIYEKKQSMLLPVMAMAKAFIDDEICMYFYYRRNPFYSCGRNLFPEHSVRSQNEECYT